MLYRNTHRSLECHRHVAAVRRVDPLPGLVDRVPQFGIGVAEIGLVMPDQRGSGEILRTEWAYLAGLALRRAGDARHALPYPCLPVPPEAAEVSLYPRCGVRFQRGQAAREQGIEAIAIKGWQRKRRKVRAYPDRPGGLRRS